MSPDGRLLKFNSFHKQTLYEKKRYNIYNAWNQKRFKELKEMNVRMQNHSQITKVSNIFDFFLRFSLIITIFCFDNNHYKLTGTKKNFGYFRFASNWKACEYIKLKVLANIVLKNNFQVLKNGLFSPENTIVMSIFAMLGLSFSKKRFLRYN